MVVNKINWNTIPKDKIHEYYCTQWDTAWIIYDGYNDTIIGLEQGIFKDIIDKYDNIHKKYNVRLEPLTEEIINEFKNEKESLLRRLKNIDSILEIIYRKESLQSRFEKIKEIMKNYSHLCNLQDCKTCPFSKIVGNTYDGECEIMICDVVDKILE